MVDPSHALTVAEALEWLTPALGVGGLTSIAVAYFGWKKSKTAHQEPMTPQNAMMVGVSGAFADRYAMDRLTDAMTALQNEIRGFRDDLRMRTEILTIKGNKSH